MLVIILKNAHRLFSSLLLFATVFLLNFFLLVPTYAEVGSSFPLRSTPRMNVANEVANTNPMHLTTETTTLAQSLGWVSDLNANLCQGYYQEPLLSYQAIDLADAEDARLSADSGSFYEGDKSIVRGNVIFNQNQRQVRADEAVIYRDKITKKITRIDLFGHVEFREPARLLKGERAYLQLSQDSGRLEGVIYRLSRDPSNPITTENTVEDIAGLNAWGRARTALRDEKGNYTFYNATYTTCPPTLNSWKLSGSKIYVNKQKERVYARNVTMKLKNIPIFYTPYLSMPTNKKRHSGLLIPHFAITSKTGFDTTFPFYWNMAPNYDFTFYPRYMSQRGTMFGGEFRYLFPNSEGSWYANFLPHDREFAQFRQKIFQDFPEEVDKFQDWGDSRGALHFLNHSVLPYDWRANLDYNRVSDDYYFQDFGDNLATITQNQLLEQFELSKRTISWDFFGRLQAYQTLHPKTQVAISDVYSSLPQLVFSFHPVKWSPFAFSADSEYVNFLWPHNAITRQPSAQRSSFIPALSLPWERSYGFFIPSIHVPMSHYEVDYSDGLEPLKELNQLPTEINRVVPQYAIDTGLFFDRTLAFKGQMYHQTLEPRLFYLYVPFVDQQKIPEFDSGYYIFNFDQLFQRNRFTGNDRIGDTNQLSLGVSSRLIKDREGLEKIRLSLGQIFFFKNRRVMLCNDAFVCQDSFQVGVLNPTTHYSPTILELNYHFNSAWSFNNTIAYDVPNQSWNNATADLHYQPMPQKIFDINYSFLRNGDTTTVFPRTVPANLYQVGTAMVWPLTQHWQAVGLWRYNITHQHPENYYLGAAYQSCCWAARLLAGESFDSLNTISQSPHFTKKIYFQILFKGLGSLVNENPQQFLLSEIPGFVDDFTQRY